MKDYFKLKKSKLLLLALLTMIGGVSSAWADTLMEGFESVSVTKNGEAAGNNFGDGLSNGWVIVGGSIYQSSGSTNYGLWTNGANDSSKSLEASYGSSNSASVVITTRLSGTFTFWARKTSSSSSTKGYITLYKAEEDNGTFTVTSETITTVSSLTTNWTEYTANLGDEGVYVAINLIRAAIDDISCEKYVEGAIKKPKNLAVADGITYNSATLTWTAGGEETDWQVVYGTTADFDADAATKYDVTTNSYELTGLSENTTYYACVRAKVGDEFGAWTNKVSFTTPVQFPAPTAFALTGFTATTATFSWTAGSTETAWQISYSTNADFDPASGTTVDVTANPYTIEGLTAETTYYACIRANYSTGYSAWSEKVSFKPSNTMVTTINDGTTTNNYIPVYGNYIDDPKYNKNQFVIPSTSISAVNGREITKLTFYASATSAIAWSGNVFDIYMKETEATAPTTDFDRTGTKVFTGSLSVKADGTMEVTLNEGFHYSGANLLIGFDQTTAGSYSSASFYGVNNGSSTYIGYYGSTTSTFVPKTTITSVPYVAPSVMKPTSLSVSDINANSAKLSWTDGEEGLTAWEIKYSTSADFNPSNEGTAVEADANPFTLTGLTAETTYYAYIRAKKGTDYSDWSNKVEFMPTAYISLTVNDGTATNSYVPVYGNYVDNYDKVEFIIPASGIDAMDGGNIKSLTFYLSSPAPASWGAANFKVYLKEVSETTITSFNFTDDDIALYNGPLDGTQATMTVTFTTPYKYNGGNLLVGFYNTVKGSYKSASFYGVTAESGASVYGYNSSSLSAITTPTKQSFLPKTTFTYLPGTPKAQMVVTPTTLDFGTLSSSSDAADFQETFTISNISKKVGLTNLAVSCTGEGFSVSDLNSTTIAANGDAIEMTVTFAPTEDKIYDGTITVTGSDNNEATITLTGVYSNTPPTMAVTDENDADVNSAIVAFGSKGKSITKTFTVTNDGDLTLNTSIVSDNTDYFTVAPATLEVAGHSSETFDVTFVWANSDLDVEKTATITLTAGELSKNFTVTGTRIEQWSEDFANDPTVERGWYATASAGGASYGWSFADGKAKCKKYTSGAYLETPYLSVTGTTDELTFEYEATSSWQRFTIEKKVKGGEWEAFATVPSTDSYMTNGATETYTITGLNAGVYQFRFSEASYNLDNFEGFKLFVPEHDAMITAQSIPTSGFQNQPYTATITIKEKANKAETGVVAKLYIDDVEKATDTQDLTEGGEATFTLTFTPTEAISSKTAKIVVSYEDITLNSTNVTVTIKAVSEYIETNDNEIASGYGQNILLKRTFINGWNTICLPFAISYPNTIESVFGSGVKAYAFDSYSEENGLGFKAVTDKEMAARTPYLLFIPESNDVTALSELFFESVSVYTAEPTVTKGSENPITFQGTYSPMAAGTLTGNYVLTTTAKIAKAGSNASLKAFRAYFTAPAGARMAISFDDNTTGIGAVTTDGKFEVGAMYNLNGQKVEGTQKGLYIINGKKVVVK